MKIEFGNPEHIKLRDKVKPKYYCEDCGEEKNLCWGVCIRCGGGVKEGGGV